MKKTSTTKDDVRARAKREIAVLKKLPDSAVSLKDIPLQDPNDPKWLNAETRRFYRPIKQSITVRVDADVLAWLKAKPGAYQKHLNAALRTAMLAEHHR